LRNSLLILVAFLLATKSDKLALDTFFSRLLSAVDVACQNAGLTFSACIHVSARSSVREAVEKARPQAELSSPPISWISRAAALGDPDQVAQMYIMTVTNDALDVSRSAIDDRFKDLVILWSSPSWSINRSVHVPWIDNHMPLWVAYMKKTARWLRETTYVES
jgi:alkanesulfonate monooxygenase SsuD/methylene tetrahydromethanopterin reductase-like flavin-dependent oxidoreductase (luciferase family)